MSEQKNPLLDGANMVKGMQRFARAMVGAILFLPVIGLGLALSSILVNPSFFSETSFFSVIGRLVGGMLWPIFSNLGLIFCIALSFGLAKDKKPGAALIALMCYILFLGANSTWLQLTNQVAAPIDGSYAGTGQAQVLGFVVIDMGVFLGIILGGTIAWVHNRMAHRELPDAIAIYGGEKLTLLAMAPVTVVYAVVFSFLWPYAVHGIEGITGFMRDAGSVGVFVYGFFEKFLIPTGLHHLIGSPIAFTPLGGSIIVNGEVVSGMSPIFLTYMRHPDLTPLMHESLRFGQQGMVGIFGLPGAALAFYHTAKPEKKAMAKAILVPAILTSMLVGITEPIEFTFLFISPMLWVVHSTLTALSQVVCDLFSVRPAGNSGIIDFLMYNLPLPVTLTRWPWFIVIGIGQFFVYYAVFRTLILKLKLKTPGREDDESVVLYTKADYLAKKEKEKEATTEKRPPTGESLGDRIVAGLGGSENVIALDSCFSRLRIELRDVEKLNEGVLAEAGARGIIRKANEVQVVYGAKVEHVRAQVEKSLADMRQGDKS